MKIEEIKVEYVDHMGSDLNVCNAARVSFNKQSNWEYASAKEIEEFDELLKNGWEDITDESDYEYQARRLSEGDKKLINYLAKHKHWSPLAHTSITLRIKAPIFLARQYVKHQVGGVWNEVSRRYVDDEPSFWFPEIWHGRPTSAKQGSSDENVTNKTARLNGEYGDVPVWKVAKESSENSLESYNSLIKAGVAPEEARIILPLNSMTEWVWTGSAVFFDRVVGQRVDSHAQKAANELGHKINEVVAPIYPATWAALSKTRE